MKKIWKILGIAAALFIIALAIAPAIQSACVSTSFKVQKVTDIQPRDMGTLEAFAGSSISTAKLTTDQQAEMQAILYR